METRPAMPQPFIGNIDTVRLESYFAQQFRMSAAAHPNIECARPLACIESALVHQEAHDILVRILGAETTLAMQPVPVFAGRQIVRRRRVHRTSLFSRRNQVASSMGNTGSRWYRKP